MQRCEGQQKSTFDRALGTNNKIEEEEAGDKKCSIARKRKQLLLLSRVTVSTSG